MRRSLIISLALIGFISPVLADTTFVGGEIEEGVWDLEGSPYVVVENIGIVPGGSLNIEPGVVVLFSPYRGIICDSASFSAIGTAEDSIYFLPLEDREPWRSLQFNLSIVEFDYCFIYYSYAWWEGEGAIGGYFISLNVTHSSMIRCDSGINAWGGPINIEDCFFDSLGWAGALLGGDSLTVKRCVFGEFSISCEYVILANCIIMNVGGSNLGNGSIVEGNIFINCADGVGGNSLTVAHNVIFGDYDVFGDDNIENFGVLSRTNVNGDSTDAYGNLLMDPLLTGGETWPDRYFLTAESPCIDAGDPDAERDPDGTIADIGPFYFHQNAVSGSDFIPHPSSLILSVLPNPLNSQGVLKYQLPKTMKIRIALYDLSGREMALVEDGEKTAGTHTIQLDISDAPAGLYLARLETDATSRVVKLVNLK